MNDLSKNKVLIIGLDGASFDVIKPRIDELPVIGGIMSSGVYGNLKSTNPPMTCPAWPSFMTGKNPGKINVFDFLRLNKKSSSIRVAESGDIQSATFWELAGKANKKVCIFEIPITYPPKKVNGIIIAGYPSPDSPEKFLPSEVFNELCREIGEFKDTFPTRYKEGKEMEVYLTHKGVLENRSKAILRLLRRDWDIFVLNLHHIDTASHWFWFTSDESNPKYKDAKKKGIENLVLEAYKDVDYVLGRILPAAGENVTIFVISDHGFGRLSKMVNLNNFLAEKGYLVFKNSLKTKIRRCLFMSGLNPEKVYAFIKKIGLEDLTEKFGRAKRDKVLDKFLSFSDIDWKRTKAYSFGHVGQIYINVKDEREIVKKNLIKDLKKLKDEHGKPLVDEIFERKDVYSGEYLENAPDLILKMKDYEYIAYPLLSSSNRFIADPITQHSGGHRPEGIFMAKGPGIKRAGEELTGAGIIDIAPTVLHSIGRPVPSDMDGRVLDIFTTPHKVVEADPAKKSENAAKDVTEKSGRPQDTEELMKKLRDLGYL